MKKKKAEVVEAELVGPTHQTRFDTVPVVHQESLPATYTPMNMIQQAIAEGAGIETMERLFALQVKHEENEAKKAFNRAFAAFKTEAIEIIKTKNVKYTTNKGTTEYNHAELGNIVAMVSPKLSKHGLTNHWEYAQDGGQVTVTAVLTHELGHSLRTSLTAGKDDSGGKNAIQAVASTTSYLERYTFMAITGLAAKDQDDDGKGADTPVKYITEDQWRDLDLLLSQIEDPTIDQDYFCKCFRVDGMDLLPANMFEKAKTTLSNKIKEQQS